MPVVVIGTAVQAAGMVAAVIGMVAGTPVVVIGTAAAGIMAVTVAVGELDPR